MSIKPVACADNGILNWYADSYIHEMVDLYAIPDTHRLVPVDGFKIEAGSEAYQEIIVTAADGGQQIFWPEDAAYGLMKAMLAAAKGRGE